MIGDLRALSRLAARQFGVVSREQLLGLGYSPDAIDRRVRAGQLVRVHAGVYAVGHDRLAFRGRVMAALLACGPASVTSHWAAAALWRMLPPPDNRPIDVTSTSWRGREQALTLHRVRSLPATDTTHRHGLPMTTATRTLLDLAEVADPITLQRALGEAEYLAILTRAQLRRQLANANGRRGARPLRDLIGDEDRPQPLRSRLEARFKRLLSEAGLPQPDDSNVRVHGFLVDFVWHDQRLIVELDTYGSHSGPRKFERDRHRSNLLQAAGYTVLRITDQMLERPLQVMTTIATLLA